MMKPRLRTASKLSQGSELACDNTGTRAQGCVTPNSVLFLLPRWPGGAGPLDAFPLPAGGPQSRTPGNDQCHQRPSDLSQHSSPGNTLGDSTVHSAGGTPKNHNEDGGGAGPRARADPSVWDSPSSLLIRGRAGTFPNALCFEGKGRHRLLEGASGSPGGKGPLNLPVSL